MLHRICFAFFLFLCGLQESNSETNMETYEWVGRIGSNECRNCISKFSLERKNNFSKTGGKK